MTDKTLVQLECDVLTNSEQYMKNWCFMKVMTGGELPDYIEVIAKKSRKVKRKGKEGPKGILYQILECRKITSEEVELFKKEYWD